MRHCKQGYCESEVIEDVLESSTEYWAAEDFKGNQERDRVGEDF